MSQAQDHYKFHLIFKGLFRCVPDKSSKRLSVLLVDAHSPKRSSTGEPLRDHRAVIEFRLKDWRNRTSEPLRNLIEVNKRNKGKVGLYLLNRQDVQIGIINGQLSPELKFVEHGANSFLRLPHLDRIAPGSASVSAEALATGQNCIARVLDLDRGKVRSERPSTAGMERLRWAFSNPRQRDVIRRLTETESPERALLQQELLSAEEINLDLRVSAQVPRGATVLINPNPFPNNGLALDPPAFMLRPKAGEDLEVWIKNRELEVILTESDAPGSEEGCLGGELVDFDFELQYELSEKVKERRIPYRSDILDEGEVSNGGCACGGCTGGGPGGP